MMRATLMGREVECWPVEIDARKTDEGTERVLLTLEGDLPREVVAELWDELVYNFHRRGSSLEAEAAQNGHTLCGLPIEGGSTCIRYSGHQGRCLQ